MGDVADMLLDSYALDWEEWADEDDFPNGYIIRGPITFTEVRASCKGPSPSGRAMLLFFPDLGEMGEDHWVPVRQVRGVNPQPRPYVAFITDWWLTRSGLRAKLSL